MCSLFVTAVREADKVRRELKFDMYQPINIIDSCEKLGVTVRFVDINMEGMYFKNEVSSTILLPIRRPLPRRIFSCAHELGHHVFNHGSRLDSLTEESPDKKTNDMEELLVDSFAGALLMPVVGIQSEFAKRDWKPENSSPYHFYVISSMFGIGYQTLVVHCRANKVISGTKENILLKYTPGMIFKNLFGSATNTHFKIIDSLEGLNIIDLEVLNRIVMPTNVLCEGDHLKKDFESSFGSVFTAQKPGILRVTLGNTESCFIRIQNAAYIGLAENRHLEITPD